MGGAEFCITGHIIVKNDPDSDQIMIQKIMADVHIQRTIVCCKGAKEFH